MLKTTVLCDDLQVGLIREFRIQRQLVVTHITTMLATYFPGLQKKLLSSFLLAFHYVEAVILDIIRGLLS